MQMKPFFPGVLLVAVAALPSCGGSQAVAAAPAPAPAAPKVQVAQAQMGPVGRIIVLPATIRAFQQAILYSKTAGFLKTIRVDRGDRIKSGQLLATIEAPELTADLDKQKADVAVAEVAHRRLGDAFAKSPNLVMPQTVDEAKGRYQVALATLKRTETLLSYSRIVAPFSGVVIKRWVDVGAFIPAGGMPQTAALLSIADIRTVRVEVSVPEREVPLVKPGLPVKIWVEELAGKVFQHKVTRVAYALDEASRTMAAEIETPNPDEALRPGMYATVQITLEHKPQALTIPLDALVMEKGKGFVFTVDGDKAKRLPVKLGFKDDRAVEILDGLKPQQRVLLAAKLALTDGQTVAVVEPK